MRTRELQFVDNGRTFSCTLEPCRAVPTDSWWWFSVSSERQQQRYAPFRAGATDTPDNIRARIVKYFDELVALRAAPPTPRWGGGGPGRKPGQTAAAT